jgi:YkoP domain
MAMSAKQTLVSSYSHPWMAVALFALDARLRHHLDVIEYSANPACIFRLEIAHAQRHLVLADGSQLQPNDRIARLHFWNEHIPPLPQGGTTLRWARRMQTCISISLQELARYMSSEPDLCDIAAVCGDVPSATREKCRQVTYIMAHYGFETIMETEQPPLGERIHRLGENILISLIVFARNPVALRLDTLQRVRVPIYLSRRSLECRFGAGKAAAGAAGE